MKPLLLLLTLMMIGGGCVNENRIRVTGSSKTICVSSGMVTKCGTRGLVSDEMLSGQLIEKIRVDAYDAQLDREKLMSIEEKLNKEHK